CPSTTGDAPGRQPQLEKNEVSSNGDCKYRPLGPGVSNITYGEEGQGHKNTGHEQELGQEPGETIHVARAHSNPRARHLNAPEHYPLVSAHARTPLPRRLLSSEFAALDGVEAENDVYNP
ncbi:MAG: hypothetical protein ACRD3R_10430, partial [Terriglobales bacterium]